MTIDFDEATQVQTLRGTLSHYADNAATYGTVSRAWLNEQLAAVGAPAIAQGENTYQIYLPITGAYGTTITAANRADALEKFTRYADRVLEAGEIRFGRHGQGVFHVQANPAAGGVQFHSGPEDPEPAEVPEMDLETFRAAARKMLMDGVSQQGWGVKYANKAAEKLGVTLPVLEYRTVQVPVTGVASVTVRVFGDATGDDLTSAAKEALAKLGDAVTVKADEIGSVVESPTVEDDEIF